MDAKQCTKCGEHKPISGFYKCPGRPDGHMAQCKHCVLERQKAYKLANKEKISEYHQRLYLDQRQKIKDRNDTWRRANLDKHIARVVMYRQKRRSASPSWLSDAEVAKILAKYSEARWMTRRTGIRHEVDHIVPLQGKTVSGLHVPWNLRVIPARENAKKSNRLT